MAKTKKDLYRLSEDGRPRRHTAPQTTTRGKKVALARNKAKREGRNTNVGTGDHPVYGGEKWGGTAGTHPSLQPPSVRHEAGGGRNYRRNVAHG